MPPKSVRASISRECVKWPLVSGYWWGNGGWTGLSQPWVWILDLWRTPSNNLLNVCTKDFSLPKMSLAFKSQWTTFLPAFPGWILGVGGAPGIGKNKVQGMETVSSLKGLCFPYSLISQTKSFLLPVFATYWLMFNIIIQEVVYPSPI